MYPFQEILGLSVVFRISIFIKIKLYHILSKTFRKSRWHGDCRKASHQATGQRARETYIRHRSRGHFLPVKRLWSTQSRETNTGQWLLQACSGLATSLVDSTALLQVVKCWKHVYIRLPKGP